MTSLNSALAGRLGTTGCYKVCRYRGSMRNSTTTHCRMHCAVKEPSAPDKHGQVIPDSTRMKLLCYYVYTVPLQYRPFRRQHMSSFGRFSAAASHLESAPIRCPQASKCSRYRASDVAGILALPLTSKLCKPSATNPKVCPVLACLELNLPVQVHQPINVALCFAIAILI